MLRIPALVLVAFLAWVAFQSFQPPPGRPTISVRLLSYTNDNSGSRLAMIVVTNLSPFRVYIYNSRIEIPAPARDVPSYIARWHSMLGAGASGKFTIPPPTNQPTWRLSFFVENDVGAAQVIQRIMAGVIFGVPRYMPFSIVGPWFANEK
jgi:hypothetical protein